MPIMTHGKGKVMKKDLDELIGKVIKHKTYGPMKVLGISSSAEMKIEAVRLSDNATKTMVLSNAFFVDVEAFCESEDHYTDLKLSKKGNHQNKTSKKRKSQRRYYGSGYSTESDTSDSVIDLEMTNEHYASTYRCHACGYELTSYVDMTACPDCGSGDWYNDD